MKILVIADDLTGANATVSRLYQAGLRGASLLSLAQAPPSDYDVLAYATGSRAISEKAAYERVFQAVLSLGHPDITLYNKRIDSTLRGNLGAEITAMQDALGEEYLAVCVPSYPATGRIVRQGSMSLNGVSLEQTEIAKDVLAPLDTPVVTELIGRQYKRPMFSVTGHPERQQIRATLEQAYRDGVRLIVFDALDDEQIEVIAQALIESALPFFAVDPGPFTLSLAQALSTEKKAERTLVVVGSVTEKSMQQLEMLEQTLHPLRIDVPADRLLTDFDEVRDEVLARYAQADSALILLTTTPHTSAERLDLKQLAASLGEQTSDLSEKLSFRLSLLASEILKDRRFHSLFVSGGDILVAFCEVNHIHFLEIQEEIEPLIALTRIVLDGEPLRMITKGGMVGDEQTTLHCIEYLQRRSS